MKRRIARLRWAVVCVMVISGACGGQRPAPSPPPPTQPGSACIAAGNPTPDPSWKGSASVKSDARPSAPDRLGLKVYRFEEPFLLVFSGPKGELVLCGGPPFTGSRPTSDQVAMSIAIDDGVSNSGGLSFHGECTIEMTEMTPAGARGSFKCTDVEDNEGQFANFSASGTFSAMLATPS